MSGKFPSEFSLALPRRLSLHIKSYRNNLCPKVNLSMLATPLICLSLLHSKQERSAGKP
jgi:hypothetical protein